MDLFLSFVDRFICRRYDLPYYSLKLLMETYTSVSADEDVGDDMFKNIQIGDVVKWKTLREEGRCEVCDLSSDRFWIKFIEKPKIVTSDIGAPVFDKNFGEYVGAHKLENKICILEVLEFASFPYNHKTIKKGMRFRTLTKNTHNSYYSEIEVSYVYEDFFKSDVGTKFNYNGECQNEKIVRQLPSPIGKNDRGKVATLSNGTKGRIGDGLGDSTWIINGIIFCDDGTSQNGLFITHITDIPKWEIESNNLILNECKIEPAFNDISGRISYLAHLPCGRTEPFFDLAFAKERCEEYYGV